MAHLPDSYRRNWVSTSLSLRACLGRGTATASARALTPSRSVVHNLPFGLDHGGRGMNCMWGVHRLPRFPDSCSIGSFCMTAGVRAVAAGTNAGISLHSDPFGGPKWIANTAETGVYKSGRNVDGLRRADDLAL